MADLHNVDPFCWGVEGVVIGVSTYLAARKLPIPKGFDESLRDKEVDGETLLTYDFDGSKFGGSNDFKILWKGLGVKDSKDMDALYDAVVSFQERSTHYQAWYKKWKMALVYPAC